MGRGRRDRARRPRSRDEHAPSRGREIAASAWILLTLVPLGWLAWGALVYAGARARKRSWVAFGLVYLALIWGGTIVAGVDSLEDTTVEDVSVGIWLFSWFATLVHALVIRRPYLDRMAMLDDPRFVRAERRLFERTTALEVATEDPARAKALGVGRPDVPDALHGDVVDVNHASADALALLPGFDRRLAERAVLIRDEINGFESIDDLSLFLDLPPDEVELLRRRAVCLPL